MHGPTGQRVLLDSKGIGGRRELAEPKRQIPAAREIGVARESQPDLMRRLRPDLVKLERRDQADHAARHSFNGLDERKVSASGSGFVVCGLYV